MLSLRYHMTYWAVSAAAVTFYDGLVNRLGWDQALLRKLLIPLGAYAVYQIWSGPRPCTRGQNLCHIAATGLLTVLLGSVAELFFLPNAAPGQLRAPAHALLAFSAVGLLEPIRQNVSHSLPMR